MSLVFFTFNIALILFDITMGAKCYDEGNYKWAIVYFSLASVFTVMAVIWLIKLFGG